jgi:SAM-dependent methyltransferase
MNRREEHVEWYKDWFNSDYKRLYPHRNGREAEIQVEFLLGKVTFSPGMRVLDSACGSGRHLKHLLKHGCRAVGFDLSPFLLKDALSEDLSVFRADMRYIPLSDAKFEMATSFFSSFGYFSTAREDALVLDEFRRLVKPGGWVFLDLANASYLKENLQPRSVEARQGMTIIQTRRLVDNIVEKEIKIICNQSQSRCFYERLRLYSPEEMEKLCSPRSLQICDLFGDEKGGPFKSDSSTRMALLLQRTES